MGALIRLGLRILEEFDSGRASQAGLRGRCMRSRSCRCSGDHRSCGGAGLERRDRILRFVFTPDASGSCWMLRWRQTPAHGNVTCLNLCSSRDLREVAYMGDLPAVDLQLAPIGVRRLEFRGRSSRTAPVMRSAASFSRRGPGGDSRLFVIVASTERLRRSAPCASCAVVLQKRPMRRRMMNSTRRPAVHSPASGFDTQSEQGVVVSRPRHSR